MAIIMEDDNTSKNELTDEEPIGVDQTPLSIPVQNKCNVTSPELVITPQKRRTRKRRAQPSKWKRNVQKEMKLKGQEYCTSRGKIKKKKHLKPIDCSKCKRRCTNFISESQREDIFNTFYSLSSYERQKDFVCRHVQRKETRTYLGADKQPAAKKRQVHHCFSLTVGGSCIPVCKPFFLKTLDIGHGYVQHALDNSGDGHFFGEDGRGKQSSFNRITDNVRNNVRKHIESFPAVESHYCRRQTSKKYLDSNRSINRMHRLYVEECKQANEPPVTRSFYRNIFVTEYNYGFHKAKKDQCLLCSQYLYEKEERKLSKEREEEFQEHQQRKTEARKEKAKDKELAKQNPSIHGATFDMQAVLPTPCSLVSISYYKRKLAVYNLSIFSLADKQGSCYMWDESEGHKGSCEIGTCLFLHLKSLPETVNHVILYSDTCSGQNRNKFVAAALQHAVQTIPSVHTIDQKFLESGHSQMECDSMHSTIERAKQVTTVYAPGGWHTVVQMARKSAPYTVIPLTHADILDFKLLATSKLRNTKTDMLGNRVNWLKIKWLRYMKSEPDTLQFKYRVDEDFKVLKTRGTSGRRGKLEGTVKPSPRYKTKITLAPAKKKDLLDLCKMGVIPVEYHSFYQSLPSSHSTPDCLPESDIEDQNDTDDE